MTDYVQDLDKTSPTEFDPVADGAREIRELKIALRNTFPYANSSLDVSNESINILLNETIPNILDRLNDFDGEGGSGSPTPPSKEIIVASCKYNARDPNEDGAPPGTPLPYTHNVANVEIPSPAAGAAGGEFGSCRVTFTKPINGFDRHYTCLIQPYATTNQHVIATVTDQQDTFVEWTWLVYDGTDNTWKLPGGKIGFSFMAVDYEQN